jgi:hypothetical protein
MRQRRREATAKDSSLLNIHRLEGYLATELFKPIIFTLLRCTSAELFFSCCDSVVALRATAWAPKSSSYDAQRAAPKAAALGTTAKYLRQTKNGAAGNGLGATIKYLRRPTSGAAGIGLGTPIK